jgi:hypothetical protein
MHIAFPETVVTGEVFLVMAGAGLPSTPFSPSTPRGVDGGPSPTMTEHKAAARRDEYVYPE